MSKRFYSVTNEKDPMFLVTIFWTSLNIRSISEREKQRIDADEFERIWY